MLDALLLGGFWAAGTENQQKVQQYERAPICGASSDAGCRTQVPVKVTSVGYVLQIGDGPELRALIVEADTGKPYRLQETGGDLYEQLTENMTVQAEFWQGNIVALYNDQHTMLTAYHPQWEADQRSAFGTAAREGVVLWGIVGVGVAEILGVALLTYLAAREAHFG